MKSLDVRTKICMVMLVTSLSVIYQNLIVQSVLLAASFLLVLLLAEKPEGRKRKGPFRILRTIAIIFFAQIFFRQTGDTVLQLYFIKVTTDGLIYAGSSTSRLLIIFMSAKVLFGVPLTEFVIAFRKWKIPYVVSFMVAMVIHLIPDFSRKVRNKMELLKIRGYAFSSMSLSGKIRIISRIVVPVVGEALSQARYRVVSLEMRGFHSSGKRTYFKDKSLSPIDYAVQVPVVILFVVGVVLRYIL